jgi:pyocin large subunit-like protein
MACVAYPLRAPGYERARLVEPPPKPQSFRRGALAIHFAKHAREWAVAMTPDEYLRRARHLLSQPIGGHVGGYVCLNGDVVRYNVTSNERAVMSARGTIKTFYRPARKLRRS